MKLQKWHQVYRNDAEKNFFVGKDGKSGLVRHAEFHWRSTDNLSKESGLSKEQTEQIIDRYYKAGIIVQSPRDPEKWAYWENVSKKKTEYQSISEEDQNMRLKKADPNSPSIYYLPKGIYGGATPLNVSSSPITVPPAVTPPLPVTP